MTKQEFELIVNSRKVTQIGFLVDDIFKALDYWVNEHGVDSWNVYRHCKDHLQNVIHEDGVCNEDFAFYTASGMLGNIQLEIMQPIYGIPFYSEWLKQKGAGLHHFKEVVPEESFNDVLEYYQEQGMKILFGGEFFGSKFYFIDSVPKLGVLIELGNGKLPVGVPAEWVSVFPPKNGEFVMPI